MDLETAVALLGLMFTAACGVGYLYIKRNVKLRYVDRQLPLVLPNGKEGR